MNFDLPTNNVENRVIRMGKISYNFRINDQSQGISEIMGLIFDTVESEFQNMKIFIHFYKTINGKGLGLIN